MSEKDMKNFNKVLNIGIDAMGGDNAPIEIINGVVDYINDTKDEDTIVTLVGNENIIQSKLMNYDVDLKRIEIVNATEVVIGEDHPTDAIRHKKDSSMVVGLKMLKEDKIDAFISAGNSGALVAGGTLLVGPIKGINRPALAPIIPTKRGVSLLIDCGANVDAKPLNLVQFAQMGSIYMQNELDIKEPTVGLVNIGTEPEKGNELCKETYKKLNELDGINFAGNVEAREVFAGATDIFVCDAFTGNVILKHTEGMARDLFDMLKEQLMSTTKSKIGALLSKDAFKKLKKTFDYSEYGGAPLLGLKSLVVKAHGSSKRKEICACLKQAETFYKKDIANKIAEKITK
ncbi:MAG: phosphate acyltransferase PlsX [Clostridia bacterium]|nr:phosphate acyltransferase PlsX [Clostridia bacterium]